MCETRRRCPPASSPSPPTRRAGSSATLRRRRSRRCSTRAERRTRGGARRRGRAVRDHEREERPLPRGLRLLLAVGALPGGGRAGLPARRRDGDRRAGEGGGARRRARVLHRDLGHAPREGERARDASRTRSGGCARRPPSSRAPRSASCASRSSRRLKAAGLMHYHHNLETARSYFEQRLHDPHLRRAARDHPRREAARAQALLGRHPRHGRDARAARRARRGRSATSACDCVPMNFLNPRPGTPMADVEGDHRRASASPRWRSSG